MIPLIEDYLKSCLAARLNWMKENPEQIPKIFGVLGKRSSLKNLQEYIKKTDFKILTGFPKDPSYMPCYVITLAGESEVSAGLGDCIDEDIEEYEDDEVAFEIDTVYMKANYRLEVWSDNSDLAVYMYILAKWAMLVSRHDMLQNGLITPEVSGGDLEPAPDYFPQFVYRKAVMISFMYENEFYEDENELGDWDSLVIKPKYYSKDI